MLISKQIVFGYAIALGITCLGTSTGLVVGNYSYQEALQSNKAIAQERKFLNTLQLDILYNRPAKQLSPYLSDPEGFRRESGRLLDRIQKILTALEAHNSLGAHLTIEGLHPLLQEYEVDVRKFKQTTQELIDRLDVLTASPKTLKEAESQLIELVKTKDFLKFIDFPDRLSPFTELALQREYDSEVALNQSRVLRDQIVIASLILSIVIASLFAINTSKAIAQEQTNTNQKLQEQLIEFKRSEDALQKSEAHQRALISAIPDIIARINREGIYLEFVANPNFFVVGNILELVGTHIYESLPPPLAQRRIDCIDLALQTRSMQVYEQDLSIDGRTQIEEVRIVPYNDDEVLALIRDISDRKQVELALAASEAQSRAVLSAIPDLMFRIGADGIYREFVTQPRDFAMFSPEISLSGQSMENILPIDVAQRQFHYLRKAIETDELQIYEQTVQVDGRLQDEEVRVIKSGEDEVLFMIRDISDRKRVEASLKQSELTNRVIIETMPDLLIHMDRHGNYIKISGGNNVRVKELSGTSDEIDIYRVLPRNLAEKRLYYANQAILSKKLQIYEQFIDVDGYLCYEEVRVAPLNDREVLIIIRDITDRKEAEEQLYQLNQELEAKVKERTVELQEREIQLQKLSERLALSLKSGAIGTWEWDIGQNAILWDERMYELYGVSKSSNLPTVTESIQIVSYDIWSESLHPDDRMPTVTLLQQAALGQAEYDTEFRVVHPDGSIHFIKAFGMLVRDAHGNPQSIIGVNFDISDRKRAETQLQKTNEELIRATRLKDEFLANMSHELRTPLNAILGMNEGLKEQVYGSLNERQLQSLQTVERSGLHLLELINDILDLAKIESGQVELEYTPVSVFHLCQSSLVFVRQQAQKKHIQIETKLPLGLPDLMVDERRIRQVLINLLNNAVKFTLEGGLISLEVKQVYSDAINDNSHPHQFLRISIVDTGIGISSENVKKLFQPFIQVDSALNRRYEGTGLGLALVKRIVELHGGQVGLTSQLGVGSCFMIDLPYISSSLPSKIIAVDRVAAPLVIEKPSICKSGNASHLILLVEDNETNIRIVSDYLQSDGYRILLAKNGLEAIALAKTHHPDLILMDIQMPIMDGLEATKQIRLDPQLLHTPIIALTALVMAGDRDRCLAAGASAYLPKPVKLKELSLNIQKFLNNNTLRSNPNPEES
ncbi:MAG: hypothetical protein DCF19_13385 [Pseudanabaena frigida]|uniref:Circadian input-output histidine kinase CikA n=1 Tax=Pseudanabaena frigida TaxID=945775 RepID=A0A2W4XXY7_9CYAN|nr:MAG: hypothetical protein DCF19_13385 [Pseudanabaena frigida]